MHNGKNNKIRTKILFIILIISIIPLTAITYFFSDNFLKFLTEQSEEHYLTLMEQVSININYDLDRYKKNLDELLLDQSFRSIFYNVQFFSAIEEIKYDNDLGDEVRKKLIRNIDGDINIIQFDRKSILENASIKSTGYSLGQYRVDVNRLIIDPLYISLYENLGKNIIMGCFNKDVLVGYESDKKSVILYPIRDEKRNIIKIIIIILQGDYFINLYSHLTRLNFGTLFITDFIGNVISINHPSIYDYYEYDKNKKSYIEIDQKKQISDNKMMLDDYNNLILDPNILKSPDILEFLVDSGLETPFLKGSKTGKKNVVIKHNNIKYYTVGRVDQRSEMKYVFMIPLYHVVKPATDFIKLIFILSGSLLLALIILIAVINLIFLSPLEKAYTGLEEKNLHFMNLAHEIKTPLTLIKNYLDRYIQKTGLTDDLQVIKQNIYKLERDMVNILDSRKLELGKNLYTMNKSYSFSDILKMKEKLYNESALKKNIEMTFIIKDNLIIQADPLAIDRIINNLIDNAIKYTPNGGKIKVILDEQKDKIEFIVSDTGGGISKYNQKKLFQPYSQIFNQLGSSKGVGLGLFITHSIVKELKGSLSVTSAPDKGTTFTVRFKQAKTPSLIDETMIEDITKTSITTESVCSITHKESNIISGRKNILLVEDNPDLLFYIKTELENVYNIYISENGNTALSALKEIKKPDLIISDVMMPEMDGFQFLEYLSKTPEYKDIPLIFLSAASDHDAKIKAYHQGAVDFISKPFSIDLIIARIDSLINFQVLKKELYEKDKYATLGMLLGGISHEIFNPLLGIYAPLENLELLLEKFDTTNKEKGDRYIKNINDSVIRIENIVKSLKILYYNRDLDTELLNIDDIIKSIIDIFIKKVSDRIKIDVSIDENFKLTGNHGSMTQILVNLISNSIDAILGNGNITIKAITTKKESYLTVSDTGNGIDEKDIDTIFNAFFTTKEVGKGTGLGLYIVKDLVLRMGWKIEVTSKKNSGTTFKITF